VTRLAIIYTNFGIVDMLKLLADEMLPGVEVVNIVDDSLLNDARASGVEGGVGARMQRYFDAAEATGASVILNSCSSVGATVDAARGRLGVPVLKIDEPLADEAIRHGKRVAVLATVESTLKPTCELIEAKARESGADIEIGTFLCEGGLELFLAGRVVEHNQRVAETARAAAEDHDVIVFAQGSMSAAVRAAQEIVSVPVLSSPVLALERIKSMLGSEARG